MNTPIRMMNRRFLFIWMLAALLSGSVASGAHALEPWTKKQDQVAKRISSGISGMRNFTDSFEKARPPVRIVTRGPFAVKKYIDQLKAMSLSYRKSFGYKLYGSRSIGRKLRRIKKIKDLRKRSPALKSFAKQLEKKHYAGKGKLLDFIKDSPDKNRINGHARVAGGKLTEAVRMANRL